MRNVKVRREFTNPDFREMLKDTLGTQCIYCGSTEDVEYHHIVPVSKGGDNRLSNIVPLCRLHHCNAHDKKYVYEYKAGRKKIPTSQGAEQVFEKYLNNEIKFSEALEMTGLKRQTFYRQLGDWKRRNNDCREHKNFGYRGEHRQSDIHIYD